MHLHTCGNREEGTLLYFVLFVITHLFQKFEFCPYLTIKFSIMSPFILLFTILGTIFLKHLSYTYYLDNKKFNYVPLISNLKI